jgi:CHASE3 domain sensor protein
MLQTLSLRAKIICIFIAMTTIVLAGEGVMVWYTYRIDTMFDTMVEKEFLLYRTAQDMELALANQKGLLTYYLVDGDGKWLKSLGEHRQLFNQYLERAKAMQLNDRQQQMIDRIGNTMNIPRQKMSPSKTTRASSNWGRFPACTRSSGRSFSFYLNSAGPSARTNGD